MNYCAGIGINIDTARFVPANMYFKDCIMTKERIATCYELVLFLKDGGAAVINGKKYPISAGSIRFHRPEDKVYSFRFNEIYVLHFDVDNTEKGKKIFDSLPSFITFPDIEKEISIFKNLIAALIEQDDFECMKCLWTLLGRIKEQFQLQETNNKKQTTFQIKKYIDENFHKQLTLAEIAEKFHMHPVYIQRKFKKEAGVSPAEYQKNVRLTKAIIYLQTTDLSIEEISELCGFSNSSHFISVFKKSEGMTPFQHRQKNNVIDML